MPTTRALTALSDNPHGHFAVLVCGDGDAALRLAASPGALPKVFHAGNLTLLHAAVVGGCASAIPRLAAHDLLEAALELPADMSCPAAVALRQLLDSSRHHYLIDGGTALTLAVMCAPHLLPAVL